MKRYLVMILAGALAFCDISVYAVAETTETPVTICCSEAVYAMDLIYVVPSGVSVSEVRLCNTNCIFDWNYLESEAVLYISLASAQQISTAMPLLSIVTAGGVLDAPRSAVINGDGQIQCRFGHTEVFLPYVPPTQEQPGHTEGIKCASCGLALSGLEVIPPTGTGVHAGFDLAGTLIITGALSDETPTDDALAAIYDAGGRILSCVGIEKEMQNKIHLQIENCREARKVKIFRWNRSTLMPICNAVATEVKAVE